MKLSDGGYRPAYTLKFARALEAPIVVGVAVTNAGCDFGQRPPMLAQLEARYGQTPATVVTDGGFARWRIWSRFGTAPARSSPPCRSRNQGRIHVRAPPRRSARRAGVARAHGDARGPSPLAPAPGGRRMGERPSEQPGVEARAGPGAGQGAGGGVVACARHQPAAGQCPAGGGGRDVSAWARGARAQLLTPHGTPPPRREEPLRTSDDAHRSTNVHRQRINSFTDSSLLFVYYPVSGGLRVYQANTGVQVADLPCGPGHWNSPIVADGRIALPEGNANAHQTSGVLDIWRLP